MFNLLSYIYRLTCKKNVGNIEHPYSAKKNSQQSANGKLGNRMNINYYLDAIFFSLSHYDSLKWPTNFCFYTRRMLNLHNDFFPFIEYANILSYSENHDLVEILLHFLGVRIAFLDLFVGLSVKFELESIIGCRVENCIIQHARWNK